MKKIRVLVVEDSLVFRELLVRSLSLDPAIEIVATANDPFEARDKIIACKPDVMTLDVELPKMSGIEFLRKLMPQYPMPVVVISSLSDKVFDALAAGAVDFVAKPLTTDKAQVENFLIHELPAKIKIASIAKIGKIKSEAPVAATPSKGPGAAKDTVIAIGASTGGTEATAAVLREFSADMPGTIVVQHMPPGFTAMYANRLNNECRMNVKEAKSGDRVMPGQVLIAPAGEEHLKVVEVNGCYQVLCQKGPRRNGHCPSVDVTFESVAKCVGKRAIGIILTGMGKDGAKGLLDMRRAGARTIGQDESTCVVYGMPCEAYQCGAVEYQEKLQNIARRTYQLIEQI